MGAVPQGVLNWLHGALTSVGYSDEFRNLVWLTMLQEYHNVNRTYSDVAQTLSGHSNFSLRTDVYSRIP